MMAEELMTFLPPRANTKWKSSSLPHSTQVGKMRGAEDNWFSAPCALHRSRTAMMHRCASPCGNMRCKC